MERKKAYEKNRERLIELRATSNDSAIEIPPPYKPPPKPKFRKYVGPPILIRPSLVEEAPTRVRLSEIETDILNRRFPILDCLLFEGNSEHYVRHAVEDEGQSAIQRKSEQDGDVRNCFKYFIHDDPQEE